MRNEAKISLVQLSAGLPAIFEASHLCQVWGGRAISSTERPLYTGS